MFGRRKRKHKKDNGVADAVGDAGEALVDGGAEALADGCGCDLPLIAFTLVAGASILLAIR